jgi:hypothetical protein
MGFEPSGIEEAWFRGDCSVSWYHNAGKRAGESLPLVRCLGTIALRSSLFWILLLAEQRLSFRGLAFELVIMV